MQYRVYFNGVKTYSLEIVYKVTFSNDLQNCKANSAAFIGLPLNPYMEALNLFSAFLSQVSTLFSKAYPLHQRI